MPSTTRPIEVPDCAHRPTDVQVYPYYRVYPTADGYLCIAALSRGLREKICSELDLTDAHVAVDLGNISDELGPYKTVGHPIRFSNTPVQRGRGAPTLGQDSVAVLRDFGCSEEAIRRLQGWPAS